MIKIVLKDYAVLRGIPYAFGEKIKASLTYANPAYQAKEKAGQWISQDMPKYIYLYGEHNGSIYVPKGCMNTIIGECVKQNIPYEILDRTVAPAIEKIDFVSTLRDYQELATKDMLEKRYGFLEAATGSGKTAMGIYVITARSVRTLVLVHNKELVDQWKEALHKHTNIKNIGTMGGGKLDIQDVTVGIINSVSRHVAELKDKIGLLVVDEAHRCAGPSYITTLNSMNPKFMLGLSATPYRRDNTTNMIFQMIGPKMHVVSKKYLEDTGSVLVPRVVICKSTFQYSFRNDYSSMISALTVSSRRNTEIATAVASELQKYNEPIMVVSDRVSHCEDLFLLISRIPGARPVLVHGKQAAPVRKGGVAGIKDGTYNILIATSSLLSEGFDAPGLSALFMATPLKFSGRLVQLIGRCLRPSGSSEKPRVYDFRDILIPTLQYMGYSRDKTYKKFGWV